MQGKKPEESAAVVSYMTLPQDANPAGNVHGGVIMKLIDTTASMVATRHARKNTVTASIDRLEFLDPVYVGDVLKLTALLNMVSTSSMEVEVDVEAEDLLTGEVRKTATAYLTFVALDKNHKPTAIPPLLLEAEEEIRRNEEALRRREVRLAERARTKARRSA
jgi:uncharacterized protein (TIGR00369 family)